MKRILVVALILCLLGVAVPSMATQEYTLPAQSVTPVNTTITFPFAVRSLVLVNDGANTLYFTLSSGTATTASFPLHKQETFNISPTTPFTVMGIICGGADTSTLRVGAWR